MGSCSLWCSPFNLFIIVYVHYWPPHEKFFSFPRKSSNGKTIPEWLANPGTILLKQNVRGSKYESCVDEVELLEVNPQYAYYCYPDERETTVLIKQLAPPGHNSNELNSTPEIIDQDIPNIPSEKPSDIIPIENVTPEMTPEPAPQPSPTNNIEPIIESPKLPCRSTRIRKVPDKLNLWQYWFSVLK